MVELENTDWKAILLEMSGYCLVVIGNLIFNRIISLKILNRNVKCRILNNNINLIILLLSISIWFKY